MVPKIKQALDAAPPREKAAALGIFCRSLKIYINVFYVTK